MKVTLRTISRSAQFICVQTTPGQKAGKGPELVKKITCPYQEWRHIYPAQKQSLYGLSYPTLLSLKLRITHFIQETPSTSNIEHTYLLHDAINAQSHLLEFHASICCCVQCFAWMLPDTCQQISFTVGTVYQPHLQQKVSNVIPILAHFWTWYTYHNASQDKTRCTYFYLVPSSCKWTATILCMVMYCIIQSLQPGDPYAFFISHVTAYTNFFHRLGNLASCKLGNGLNQIL